MLQGKVMELQIFQAGNDELLGRHKWTRAAGQTKTEWYEVWPKSASGVLDWKPLAQVMKE